MAKSLNRVQLIGNLTRDPELRYTPQSTAVCTFSVATNRQWKTESGDMKDESEFHRIVAWDKLAEICAKFLKKGRKVFVEGRLQTRKWEAQDGQSRNTTEIVISDMIILDRVGMSTDAAIPEDIGEDQSQDSAQVETNTNAQKAASTDAPVADEEDIPF